MRFFVNKRRSNTWKALPLKTDFTRISPKCLQSDYTPKCFMIHHDTEISR